MKTKTSISDYDEYKMICKRSSIEEEYFNNFKQNESYKHILEHVSFEQGNQFIDEILNNNNLDFKYLEKFKENDIYGSPDLFLYKDPFRKISPSTLRYIKVLSDLVKFFGTLDDLSIVEIGIGYGGQSKIIMDYFNIKEYNFIDLPEVNLLTKTYLSKFNYSNCNFLDFENLPNKKYDLVISNYALTECTKDIQNLYIDKVLKNSSKGYMIGNRISQIFNIDSYQQQDWQFLIPNVKMHNEIPLTGDGNYLMIF